MRLYDYGASANCFKVRLLLSHLGRDYERVPVDIFAGDTLTDEFGRVNPARTTPVLEEPPGVFLQESSAILVALAHGTALLPGDRQVYRWLFYEQADVVPTIGGLRFRLSTGRVAPDDPEARRRRNSRVGAGRSIYDYRTAYRRHSPGTPLSSCAPRSSNSIPDPATRSFTV